MKGRSNLKNKLIDYAALAEALEVKRIEAGLSRAEAAAHCGMSKSTYSRVANLVGICLDAELYFSACQWLDVPLSRFVRGGVEASLRSLPVDLPTCDKVARILSDDTKLDRHAKVAIAKLMRNVYSVLTEGVASYAR